jgi:N-sulfoglucosamine sulfohydrolase
MILRYLCLPLTLCIIHCWVSASTSFGQQPPNILFAIADDWSVHAGAYGTKWVQTPNFDRVASEGLIFVNAYTPAAKCATSRASILTGRNIWQLEEAGNHLCYFPAKFTAWPEVLQKRGWHVGMTGKGWGPGIAKDSTGRERQMTGKPYNRKKTPPPTNGITNNDYAGNFADFLDAAPANSPWCFWYGSTEPHRNYEYGSGSTKGKKKLEDIERVPAYWPDQDTVRQDILDYAYEVEHVDLHLGKMLAELEKRGQLDNTLIIVTSDHGMPFPRVKGYAYKDSNHVPLAIRFPKGIQAPGRTITDFVSFIDIAPTILDYARIDWPSSGMESITGASWRAIFESHASGRTNPSRDHVLIGKERNDVGRPLDAGYPIRGITNDQYLYLHNFEPKRWPAGNPETGYLDTDGSPTKSLILDLGRKQRSDPFWQLNFGMRPQDELYVLQDDPDCVQNIALDSSNTAIVNQLREQLFMELKQQDDPRMLGKGDIFDRYPPTNGAHFYEEYKLGKKPQAGWVNETDFEDAPTVEAGDK